MRFSLLLTLCCACVGTGRPIGQRMHPPTWPDTETTIASIRCALLTAYAPSDVDRVMGGRVIAVDEYKVKEHIPEPIGDPPIIYVKAEARTALSSALRHAYWVHLLPYFLSGDLNRYHAPVWEERAKELDVKAGRCRLAAEESGQAG